LRLPKVRSEHRIHWRFVAPAQLPGVRDVSKVAAGTYKLEPDHRQVLFTFNHLGFTDYTGQFVQPSGRLTIDPAHPHKSKVDVTFAIARVTTTSAHLDQALGPLGKCRPQ
jgi:polyisoprenoid-binding protein YceI